MPKKILDKVIYDAVIQVISESGYAGASTKKIADIARVSEVTLFRKYGTKSNMVKLAISELIKGFGVLKSIRYTGNVEEDLSRVVIKYQEMMRQYGRFVVILVSEIPRYEELRTTVKSPLAIMQSFGELILRYQEEGVLRPEPPLQAVGALIGPFMYLGMMKGASEELLDLTISPKDYIENYLNGRLLERSQWKKSDADIDARKI